jgi:hypothetical protein
MSEIIPIAIHYESYITVFDHPSLGRLVRKQYRDDHPCINWLNETLQDYYPKSKFLPVALHEARALNILSAIGLAPRLICCEANAVVMEYAGVPITANPTIDALSFYRQAVYITERLISLGFRHNDLLPRNVVVLGEKVRLIDFTMSEFANIRFIDKLPNRGWARSGEDYRLFCYGELYCQRALPNSTD